MNNNNDATENRLRRMVDARDWAGIVKFLKEKDSAKNDALFVFDQLTSIHASEDGESLMIYLLKECDDKEAVELISTLITLGGQDLVMRTFWFEYGDNGTLLHAICRYNQSIDLVSKLIDVGGEALALVKDNYGRTSLHVALEPVLLDTRNEIDDDSIATINHLIQYGGAEILTQRNNKGMTPLESIITEEIDYWVEEQKEAYFAKCGRVASLLIKRGIELQVEGEYDIGGLLSTSSDQEVKEKIYNRWDRVVLPALEQVMAEPHNRQLPVLQSMVVNGAPPHIIKSVVDRIPHSANNPDSHGRYPIDLAVRHGLAWDNGMKEILEGSTLDGLERKDTSTGLYPFMVAALREKENGYDFDTVFHMIKSSAKLVRSDAGN